MAVITQKLTFTLALIFATSLLLTESTVTTTTKFDSYIGIANKLTTPAERLRIFEAVWGEIRAEKSNNLTQIKVFYDALLNGVNSSKLEEQQQTAELSAVVRDVLVNANAQLLAETLNNNKSQDVTQVKQYRLGLYNDYNLELLNAIFERAIDLALPYHDIDELATILSAVDLGVRNEKLTYRVKVNWSLYLYYKFLARGDINDKYVYEAALAFQNLKRNQALYKILDNAVMRRIDAAFNSFTTSLRHLFNSTDVCLENYNFANYYLYFPISAVTNGVRSVQAVLKNAFIEHTVWSNGYGKSNQYISQNQFYLQDKATNWLLYRRVSDKMVIVQSDVSNSNNRWWTPALRNDSIMFENSGFYMCATSDYNNTLQGFNIKAVQPKTLDDAMCQWRVTNCAEFK